MQTNMKSNWTDEIFKVTMAPYTVMCRLSAFWSAEQNVKFLLGDYVTLTADRIMQKSNMTEATHYIRCLEGTAANTKHRITLESLSTHLIEIIDL